MIWIALIGLIASITPLIYTIYLLSKHSTEPWSWTTFTGTPGPIENPYRTNVPALYGNPKYESPCHYDLESRSGPYITKSQYPKCGTGPPSPV